MPPSQLVLAYWSNPAFFREKELKRLRPTIRAAVPWVERMKWAVVKAFLDSEYTVKDLQLRLGLHRPNDVWKMMFTYKKEELRTGALMGAMEDALEFTTEVGIEPFRDSGREHDVMCDVLDKLCPKNREPFTDEELAVVFVYLCDGKRHLPTEYSRERRRKELAESCSS